MKINERRGDVRNIHVSNVSVTRIAGGVLSVRVKTMLTTPIRIENAQGFANQA